MGKILIIQGADFSTNKVDTVKIRPKDWIDYEIYISSVEEIENPEYKVVYLDSDDKILYGMYSTPKKKQEVIAQECGYSNAAVVRVMASRCKSKFHDKFKFIYDSFKKGL